MSKQSVSSFWMYFWGSNALIILTLFSYFLSWFWWENKVWKKHFFWGLLIGFASIIAKYGCILWSLIDKSVTSAQVGIEKSRLSICITIIGFPTKSFSESFQSIKSVLLLMSKKLIKIWRKVKPIRVWHLPFFLFLGQHLQIVWRGEKLVQN